MKIGQHSLLRPRLSIGFKKLLLALNRDLDTIKLDIECNYNLRSYFDHSIYPDIGTLSQVEITILFLEDRRFFIHRGVEARAIARGLKRFVSRGRIGGISTIDQQVVRISTARHQRTASRKGKELLLAFFLNFHCSKRRIFDFYIHNAYMGHGIQGCEVAAKKLFGIGATGMDKAQSSLVASLLPLPLPKSVWEVYECHQLYPFRDPNEIIKLASSVAPKWAGRASYRMNIAMNDQGFKPKSL